MSVWQKNVVAITLFVADLARSKSFYQDVFGLSAVYEDEDATAVKFENMIINLLRVPAARDLIEPAAVGSGADGACFQLTIGVDDTDAVCADLRARGVTLLNGPVNRPWGLRTASFADPDGHIWEVAQNLPPSAGG